jgi:hypothetical protein
MRPWQDYQKQSRLYRKAASKAKHPQSRRAAAKNAKRFAALAQVSKALTSSASEMLTPSGLVGYPAAMDAGALGPLLST